MTLLREIFNPFFNNALRKLSNFPLYDFISGVNRNRLSIIASEYFLLCGQFKMALMHDYHIDGDGF